MKRNLLTLFSGQCIMYVHICTVNVPTHCPDRGVVWSKVLFQCAGHCTVRGSVGWTESACHVATGKILHIPTDWGGGYVCSMYISVSVCVRVCVCVNVSTCVYTWLVISVAKHSWNWGFWGPLTRALSPENSAVTLGNQLFISLSSFFSQLFSTSRVRKWSTSTGPLAL